MGKKKIKKTSKIIQFGQNDVDENSKSVFPIDEIDMHFLQIISDDNTYSGISSAAVGMSNKTSTESLSNEKMTARKNTVTQFNTVIEEIDFTTYMKIVNVFNESDISITGSATEQVSCLTDNVVKDKTPEAKTIDHNRAAKLEVVKNNEHQVTLRVSSGEEVKVSMNNFHGFWTSGDGVQCVCRVCMIMVNDLEAHKMDLRHMKMIAPILKDVHCIRKIGPIFNHCVLCNEIIENIEFHLQANEAHTKYLEEALELCDSTTETQNNTVNSDVLCVSRVAGTSTSDNSTSQSSIDSYWTVLDKSLTVNVKSHIDMNIKEVGSKTKPAVVKNVTTNESKDLVFCDVCDRTMHVDTLKSHKEGKYHKAKFLSKSKHKEYTEVVKNCDLPSVSGVKNITANQYPVKENLTFNKPVKENFKMHNDKLRTDDDANREQVAFATCGVSTTDVSKNITYCTVCNKTMHINDLKSHEESKYHNKIKMLDKKIKKAISGTSTSDTSTSQSTTDSCRTALDKSLTLNVKSPIAVNIKEAESTTKPAVLKNVSTTNESEDFVFCDVCDRIFHVYRLEYHLEGEYHKAKLLGKSKHKEYTEVVKNCDLPRVSGVKNITAGQYPAKENFTSNKPVKENIKMYNDKLRANGGANGEKVVLNTDKRVSTSDESKNITYCTLCNKTMHINDLKSHEVGEYHKRMLMLDKKIEKDISNNIFNVFKK